MIPQICGAAGVLRDMSRTEKRQQHHLNVASDVLDHIDVAINVGLEARGPHSLLELPNLSRREDDIGFTPHSNARDGKGEVELDEGEGTTGGGVRCFNEHHQLW